MATRGCPWVNFKFRHASILGEGRLGQRWRIWDPMGAHNNFFRKKSASLNSMTLEHMLPSMTTVLALLYHFPFNFLTGYLFDYFQMTTILACSSPRTWSWQSRFSIIFHSSFQNKNNIKVFPNISFAKFPIKYKTRRNIALENVGQS